jgi:hypothetical protein
MCATMSLVCLFNIALYRKTHRGAQRTFSSDVDFKSYYSHYDYAIEGIRTDWREISRNIKFFHQVRAAHRAEGASATEGRTSAREGTSNFDTSSYDLNRNYEISIIFDSLPWQPYIYRYGWEISKKWHFFLECKDSTQEFGKRQNERFFDWKCT